MSAKPNVPNIDPNPNNLVKVGPTAQPPQSVKVFDNQPAASLQQALANSAAQVQAAMEAWQA